MKKPITGRIALRAVKAMVKVTLFDSFRSYTVSYQYLGTAVVYSTKNWTSFEKNPVSVIFFMVFYTHPGPRSQIFGCKKFYIPSKYLLPPQRRLRSCLGVTLTGDLVEEADGGLRSCPIPF